MLVLSRRVGQEIVIGDNIRLVVTRIDGHTVRLGIQAPPAIVILRKEVIPPMLSVVKHEHGEK